MASNPSDPRERLRGFIADLAVVRGRVTLASGLQADAYLDLRRVTLHAQAAPLVGEVMLDLLDGLDLDAVGGLTMGADPVATAILHAAARRGRRIDAFVVRKESKAHGLQRRIEGPELGGRAVVVVEDTSTTGASALTAAQAVTEAGGTVLAVATLADRDTGAAERFAAAGYPYRFVYRADELGL